MYDIAMRKPQFFLFAISGENYFSVSLITQLFSFSNYSVTQSIY